MDDKKTSTQEAYMMGHGFRESARLHLQHWIWKYRLGYLLHPSILERSDGTDMRIIDIGTGNACWLLELADQSPPTWQFEGIDISRVHFPADEYLPKNVSLTTCDVLGDIPDDLVGKFDVVHIRTFALVVKHDPMTLLKNLVRMLKPGGYLQWDEFDLATYSVHAPNDHTAKQKCEELLRVFQLYTQKAGFSDFRWISDMSSIFELVNLEGTDSSRFSPIDDLRKAWTDNTMMGMEEVGANASAALQGSEIDFRELLRDAVQETQQGVSFGVDMVVTVGRKAAAQSSEGSWSMMNRALYAFCRETFVQGVDFGGMAKFFMRPR